MRSYNQRCGLAKALDIVGDRWTMLLIRELLIRGGARYTDLRAGLPGIASNLLADRLRELEQAGLVGREEAPPPVATTLFHLTDRGRALEPALMELGRWGAPLVAEAPQHEILIPHWLVLPLRLNLVDLRPDEPAAAIEIRADGQSIAVTADAGAIAVRLGRAVAPAVVVSGSAEPILRLLTGAIGLEEAAREDVEFDGDRAALDRVIPRGAGAPA